MSPLDQIIGYGLFKLFKTARNQCYRKQTSSIRKRKKRRKINAFVVFQTLNIHNMISIKLSVVDVIFPSRSLICKLRVVHKSGILIYFWHPPSAVAPKHGQWAFHQLHSDTCRLSCHSFETTYTWFNEGPSVKWLNFWCGSIALPSVRVDCGLSIYTPIIPNSLTQTWEHIPAKTHEAWQLDYHLRTSISSEWSAKLSSKKAGQSRVVVAMGCQPLRLFANIKYTKLCRK